MRRCEKLLVEISSLMLQPLWVYDWVLGGRPFGLWVVVLARACGYDIFFFALFQTLAQGKTTGSVRGTDFYTIHNRTSLTFRYIQVQSGELKKVYTYGHDAAVICRTKMTPTPVVDFGPDHAYPGGRRLVSTTSSASFTCSSFGPYRGERGKAIRPVRADSRIPNGAMSFMKESILVGLAELQRRISKSMMTNMYPRGG